ncbi:MAG TPA: hypothetical protein VNZ52_11175, partial [Candidatus Thermoplasmatota archaeon]|nr:hypothetical protein [Candidatus Thermoplasmatota archaeon]
TEIIRFEGDLVVTDPPTPVEDNRTPTTNGSAPSTGLPGTPSTVTAPGASQGGHTIIYVPSQPELAWLIPLAAGVAVLSLLVAALSLALCLYLMVVLRRERLQ